MTEEIFKSKIKYKGKFDVGKLYEFIHNWLDERNWKDTQLDKDCYEKYYYERITREGLKFYEIQWEAYKTFSKESPKIKHFLKITFLVIAYNPQTQTGDLEISIKAEREVQHAEKPKVGSTSESALVLFFKIKPEWLFGIYQKKEAKKILKRSRNKLFEDTNKLKNAIQSFLRQYYYQ